MLLNWKPLKYLGVQASRGVQLETYVMLPVKTFVLQGECTKFYILCFAENR